VLASRPLRWSVVLLAPLAACGWFDVDEKDRPLDAGPAAASGRLVVPELGPGDELGAAAAAGPGLLAVGAPGDDRQGSQAGAVHVLVQGGGGWSEESVIVAAEGLTGDRFGAAVALSGDTLAVGAPGRDVPESGDQPRRGQAGVVFVLRRDGDGWREAATLIAPDAAVGDQFGASIAFLDADHLAVGAPGHDADQPGAGATYVFERQPDDDETWQPVR
jgi:hypothetical protein